MTAIERAWRAASPEARRIMAGADFDNNESLCEALGLLAIEVERGEDGYHAVVIEIGTDAVLHVSDSYAAPEDAKRAARTWICTNG
jgi:hypothetical protein